MRIFTARPVSYVPPPPTLVPLTDAALNIIAHGNSWVANYYASDAAHGFVQVAAAAMGVSILNKGAGSEQISGSSPGSNSMMAKGHAEVDANLNVNKRNIVLGLEGINECVGGSTGAQAIAAYRAYYLARHAAAAAIGAPLHICLLTAAPAWIGVGPDYYGYDSINAMNAAMLVLNDGIRNGVGVICDSYLDAASIPQFVLPNFLIGSFQSSGVYSGRDNVHPNDLGHQLIGAYVAANNAAFRHT